MAESIDQARRKAAEWLSNHPHAALYDAENLTLLGVALGKSLSRPWGDLKGVGEKNPPRAKRFFFFFFVRGGRAGPARRPGRGRLRAVDGEQRAGKRTAAG